MPPPRWRCRPLPAARVAERPPRTHRARRRNAACRKHGHARHGGQQLTHHGGRAVELFKVVEDEQRLLGRRASSRTTTNGSTVAGGSGTSAARIVEGSRLARDSERRVDEPRATLRGSDNGTGQPRLAGPACSGQRHQPPACNAIADPVENVGPPDQRIEGVLRHRHSSDSSRTGTYRRGDLSLRDGPGAAVPQVVSTASSSSRASRTSAVSKPSVNDREDRAEEGRRRGRIAGLDPQSGEPGRRPELRRQRAELGRPVERLSVPRLGLGAVAGRHRPPGPEQVALRDP